MSGAAKKGGIMEKKIEDLKGAKKLSRRMLRKVKGGFTVQSFWGLRVVVATNGRRGLLIAGRTENPPFRTLLQSDDGSGGGR